MLSFKCWKGRGPQCGGNGGYGEQKEACKYPERCVDVTGRRRSSGAKRFSRGRTDNGDVTVRSVGSFTGAPTAVCLKTGNTREEMTYETSFGQAGLL